MSELWTRFKMKKYIENQKDKERINSKSDAYLF